MGSRMGKAMLAVGVLLLVAGGGAAAWVAASDDSDGSPFGASVASEPESSTSPPVEPTPTPAPAPAQPDEPEPNLDPSAPPSDDPPSGAARETRFPRERERRPTNDRPAGKFTVPPAREFSGTGNATLGTVNVSRSAIVKWKTNGSFELRFGRESFPIIAPSPSGQLVVPPYNFEKVRVIAKGRWRITITPES